jgi:cobalamin biosynthesis protein CobD
VIGLWEYLSTSATDDITTNSTNPKQNNNQSRHKIINFRNPATLLNTVYCDIKATMTSSANHQDQHQQARLGNHKEWEIRVNDHRVLLSSKQPEKADSEPKTYPWIILSSAVLNGGFQQINCENLQILNAKVHPDYDGVTPNPLQLLQELAQQQEQQEDPVVATQSNSTTTTSVTIGMMTAASMDTVRVSTQQAACQPGQQHPKQHVIVDAIVTSGISNSRVAGADADYFSFASSSSDTSSACEVRSPPGTINTIIVTNATLDTTSALVEAYAVACEAKCRAVAELGIFCCKHPDKLATGTGTDCTMFVCKGQSTKTTPSTMIPRVEVAGKHTLFGELVGQAVYRATRESLMTNIQHRHGGRNILLPIPVLWRYRLACYKVQVVQVIKHGHRPQVPSTPMNPIPKAQGLVLFIGIAGVLGAFGIHIYVENIQQRHLFFEPSISVLLAVFCWDRFLTGSLLMPISFHPVVLVGKLITSILRITPESCFEHQHFVLGVVAGCLLFLGTLCVSLTVPWCLLTLSSAIVDGALNLNVDGMIVLLLRFFAWFVELYVVKSALSLQLLCTIALQMAHMLNRGQIQQARDQLSWLCSRDPSTLQLDDLAGGTLESLAENLSDSLVAPLIWYVLLGPLGAFGFRVINTLDSRVGYRGGRFEYVGKPSARCDDMLCLLPARLTALLLALAGGCVESSESNRTIIRGLKVAFRDAGQCDSPNAGWPMATLAGVLNVCLEKKGQYALNKVGQPPGPKAIREGHRIAELAGFMSILLAVVASSLLNNCSYFVHKSE